VLAALNVGAHAARVTPERMVEEFLPVLRHGAQELAMLLP
jgi:IclR family pca regulon transcriptional regulator